MFSNFSKKELKQLCEAFTTELGGEHARSVIERLRVKPAAATSVHTVQDGQEPSAKKLKGVFDFSQYPQTQIVLWVSYLGERYSGLTTASPNALETDNTVEWYLIQALKKVKLIDPEGNLDTWKFSRCGRTDRGVSALSQVVSLRVRTNRQGTSEFDYPSMLNSNLPQDIFVLAWAPAPESSDEAKPFDARFDCKSRTYRYFFQSGSLDLAKMQQAADYLVGEHDFRNFCKIDVSNQHSYVRMMHSCDVVQGGPGKLSYVQIKANAFLWHQIRLIMSVLFFVASGVEEPQVVRELLNVDKVPSRPAFGMARELPLVLFDCAFEGLDWQYSEKSISRLINALRERQEEELVRCELTSTFLERLLASPFPAVQGCNDLAFEEVRSSKRREKHQALLNRAVCKSVQEHHEKS